MNWRKVFFSHNALTIWALLLGFATAWLDNATLNSVADGTADIAVRLMKLVAIPLLFLSIVSAAGHFRNLSEIKNLGITVVKYTVLTTVLAAMVAEAIYFFASPILINQEMAQAPAENSQTSGFFSALLQMIPGNITEAFLENNVMAIVVIAIALALGLLGIKKTREKEVVFAFFSGLLDALMLIVHKGLRLLPIAVWAFVTMLARQILNNEGASINAVGAFMLMVISANLIQGIVILPLLLLKKGINPWQLFIKVKEAITLAFFSRSSAAALPVTLDNAVKNAGIREDIARITLPLCTTINMNGCAQFILLSFYFVCSFNGYNLDFYDHLAMIMVSVIAAIGNAGVPMGCFFLASSILASKNIPVHIMGSILPLYAFMDMVETALNVWSDVGVTKIVDKEQKLHNH